MEVLISKTKPEMVWYNCRKLAWERGLQGLSTGRWELIVTWKLKRKTKQQTVTQV